jgi:cobalamin biosynthesis protein CobT
MPKEDDDALSDMLGDRLKDTQSSEQAESGEDDVTQSTESGENTNIPESADATKSTQITESTYAPDSTPSTQTTDEDTEKDTARSRSPFPLYITPVLKERTQKRFEKFNAQRTLNDKPKVEKHRHFMQGLLRAGLDQPDLEEYVLEEFEDS